MKQEKNFTMKLGNQERYFKGIKSFSLDFSKKGFRKGRLIKQKKK